jgi:AcrR family transcriptional regulator
VTPDARPTRRRLSPEVRRKQVLDAAVAVFSEEGFHEASMEAVAARAGVSKPMVYVHGGTKEELFATCLQREGERLLRTVTQAVTETEGPDGVPGQRHDPETRLWLGLRAFFGAVTTRRAGWAVLYRQASTGAFAADIAAMRTRIVERVAALLADGLETPREAEAPTAAMIAPLAYTLVGAAEGLADWWLEHGEGAAPDGGEAADQLASTVMSVVWPGIDALRAGRVWTPPIASSTGVSPDR